jgi:hypothetical protein
VLPPSGVIGENSIRDGHKPHFRPSEKHIDVVRRAVPGLLDADLAVAFVVLIAVPQGGREAAGLAGLMVGGGADANASKIGRPLVSGAKVVGKILRQDKDRKVLHFRKEKEGWTRRRGHRQPFTEVKVTSISS